MDWLVAILTWLSTDQRVVDNAAPRAAAAAEVAYASLPRVEKPAPGTKPDCKTGNCPKR